MLDLIRVNPSITYSQLQSAIGKKHNTVYERVKALKEMGLIKREGGRSSGKWIIME